jgi:hypothetical protein
MKPKSRVDAASSTLTTVEEGMDVRDVSGESIGTVRDVYLGAPVAISGTTDQAAEPSEGPLDRLVTTLSPADPLPREVIERLRQQGFIRIDSAGVFASDRYATAAQIASVSHEGVRLAVSGDELLAA